VGVSGCSVSNRADEQHDTHGEVVWSWSPDAETNARRCLASGADGGKNAGPRGERV